MKPNLSDIPASPLAVARCGKCGCAAGKGAHGSGHSTACEHYDHRLVELDAFRDQRCSSPEGQAVTAFLFGA